MIYRRRVRKTGYSISLLRQHIKVEFGVHVLYLRTYTSEDLGIGKPWHTLLRVFDHKGNETVTHERRRDRATVDKYEVMDSWAAGFNAASYYHVLQKYSKAV